MAHREVEVITLSSDEEDADFGSDNECINLDEEEETNDEFDDGFAENSSGQGPSSDGIQAGELSVVYDGTDHDEEEDTMLNDVLNTSNYSQDQCNERILRGHYEILTSDQILGCMDSAISEANEILKIPQTKIRKLLNDHKWDVGKLMERYYDRVDQDSHMKTEVVQDKECPICFMEIEDTIGTLSCGHRFCFDCITHHVRIQIMDEGQADSIKCLQHKCEGLVDDHLVLKAINDPEIRVRFFRQMANGFVSSHVCMRWCTKAGCDRAVKVEEMGCQPIKCSCGQRFCFKCGKDWHDPIQCDMLTKWEVKCKGDSLNTCWIMKNTKPCPKCQTPIEKNGGCNFMRCRKCQTGFCWMCCQPCADHACPCGLWSKAPSSDPDKWKREDLQRWQHYFDRYANHRKSLELEQKLIAMVEEKISNFQAKEGHTPAELQFLNDALDVLKTCRLTLMYSYVFAYYCTVNNQQIIFEGNLKDLQESVEKLSGCLEHDVKERNLPLEELKGLVQDRLRYCQRRRQVLVDHVKEGHDRSWWTYIQVAD